MSRSQDLIRLWAGRIDGKSGDRYMAMITAIPTAPETHAAVAIAENRARWSRSQKVTPVSRKSISKEKAKGSTANTTES